MSRGREFKSAYEELLEFLRPDETVEAIVFGDFGWSGFAPGELGYDEQDPPPVPFDKRRIVMTLEQAKPYMQSWEFEGGFGAPECYETYVWTNQRVIFVSEYDGSTGLNSVPRNPIECDPRFG